MKNGTCPKCDSGEVYSGSHITVKTPFYGMNAIPIKVEEGTGNNGRPFTYTDMAVLEKYICGRCGYVETYITSETQLQEIRDTWPRVSHE